jgi:hypothetical protein
MSFIMANPPPLAPKKTLVSVQLISFSVKVSRASNENVVTKPGKVSEKDRLLGSMY